MGVSRSPQGKKGRIYQQISKYENMVGIGRVEIFPFSRQDITFKEMNKYEKIFINILQPKYNENNLKKDIFESRVVLNKSDVNYENYDYYTMEELKKM